MAAALPFPRAARKARNAGNTASEQIRIGSVLVLNPIIRCLLAAVLIVAAQAQPASAADERPSLDALIAQHASANGVPVSLVRRVIMRESRYNSRAVTGGNYGLMQIRLRT